MSEIELIIRIMIANVYHYGTTSMIEFNENHINEIVPKLNELFSNYGYKTEIFLKDEQSLTYKKFKDLMLSIFGDIIYIDDRPYDENWFGLYDENMKRIDIVSITYEPNDQEIKTARFGNIELNKTYYVYELDSNGQPIEASKEAIVNTMNYQVVYEANGKTTNSAQNGDTFTVTNKSRTKILPSTGGTGNLIYRMSGTALVVVGVISLWIIDKKKRKKKVGESNEIN